MRLGGLCIAALLAACASDQPGSLRLETPRSLSDLLVNVKQVTRSGVLLRDDFYTEENLRQVFGGQIVDIGVYQPNGRRTGATVKGFPAWSELNGTAGGATDAVALSMVRSFTIDGEEQAALSLESKVPTTLGFKTSSGCLVAIGNHSSCCRSTVRAPGRRPRHRPRVPMAMSRSGMNSRPRVSCAAWSSRSRRMGPFDRQGRRQTFR